MVIIGLDGGMGNQLFQYAMGRYLAGKLNTELKLDTENLLKDPRRSYALHHFKTQERFCTPLEKKKMKQKEFWRRQLNKIGFSISPYWYTEPHPGYHPYLEQLTNEIYCEGFWQSEKYFKPIEDSIRKEFVVKTEPSQINKDYLEKIRACNAVSIHVRRGDYVTNEITHSVHGVCDTDYYHAAINYVAKEIKEPAFFIFSDDITWTKRNITISDSPVTYVEHNAAAAHEDLRLMYNCRHHIIANSSFSWWGAWLGGNPGKKVIAPKKWFRSELTNKDILPGGWITF